MMVRNQVIAPCMRGARKWTAFLLICCGCLIPCSRSAAADPAGEDKIIFTLSSADSLMADMEYMVKVLAKKQKQWGNDIEPNIELFLDGVDRTKPVRMDLFFDEKQAEYYRPYFPITDLPSFRNNLDALGITSAAIGKNLYRLESAFEGQMRILNNYSVFAPKEWLQIIPADLPGPGEAIKDITAPKYDAAVKIDHPLEGVERRRNSLKQVIANALAEVKKKSTESPDEYNLRKLLATNQLEKFQNLYAELDTLEAGWVTDVEKKEGRGNLILTATPGTSLDENLKQIPQLKSRFTRIPETEKFVATGRLQIPVSLPQQKRLAATYQAYLPVINQKIDTNKEMDDKQKQASKLAVQKVMALLEKGFELGMFDAFMEVRKGQNPKLHEAIGGVQLLNGRDVDEIVKLFPQIHSRFEVKMNVASEQDFQFHEILMQDKVPSMLESLFGVPCKINVATSDKLLLVGFGDNSLEWLRTTARQINEQPEPHPLPYCLTFKGHMEPFAKALNTLKPNKDRPELRGMLVEAFSQGDDYLEVTNKFENDQLLGTLRVEPGMLRFLGLAVAKFAEENL
ncbi:MAG: hypothetical protein R3C12_10620 [Planctomycetaceae bacterium]|nr:hypothetical protein [Planctomycetaceae bacterium]